MPAYNTSPDALTERDQCILSLKLFEELEELRAQKRAAEDAFVNDIKQCILATARDQDDEAELTWATMKAQRTARAFLRRSATKMKSEGVPRSDPLLFQQLAQTIFRRVEAPLATTSSASPSSKRKADDVDTEDKPSKKAKIARKPVPKISS